MASIEQIKIRMKEIESEKSRILNQMETTEVNEVEKESLDNTLKLLDKEYNELNLSFQKKLRGLNTDDKLKKLIEMYPELQIHWNITERIGKQSEFKDVNYLIMKSMMQSGTLSSVGIEGPTGTGKTTAFRRAGYELKKPFISVNCSLGLDEEDLFGKLIPVRGADGKMEVIFVDGPLTLAAKAGVGIVLEEVNSAKPSVLMKINMVLDNLKSMEYRPGHYIETAEGFFLGATMNHGYDGTRPINLAFANRFQFCYKQKQHSKLKLFDILKKQVENVTENELNISWFIFDSVDHLLEESNFNGAISVRQIINMINIRRAIYEEEQILDKTLGDNGKVIEYGPWIIAANAAISNQVGAFDPEIYESVKSLINKLENHIDTQGKLLSTSKSPREIIAEQDKKKAKVNP